MRLLAKATTTPQPSARALFDRDLGRSRSELGKRFGREVGKPVARGDQARLTRSFLESDEKDGAALPNDDLLAVEMHPETPPRLMWNGHNKTPQDQGPVSPAFVGRG
jgi:hypothetical protein